MGLNAADRLAHVYRESGGRVLSVLIARFRDFDLAEDALQDAMIEAARVWPLRGVPDNGAGWLLKVAQRRALDRLRKAARPVPDLPDDDPSHDEAAHDIPDERLRLIFTCCHPALGHQAQVALTLRSLCGLETPEIARAFLTATPTMNQRIARAKAKIRDAGIAYRVPETADIPARLPPVLSVIYLIYNEGYAPTQRDANHRLDLSAEALRLARLLHHLMPHPEVAGLLALMLLHSSRDVARSAGGAFVPLEEQDRSQWDAGAIAQGRDILHAALAKRQAGPYQIQAAISALHAEAKTWPETDWPQITALYGVLAGKQQGPVVALNHAVAMANAGNLAGALAQVEGLETALHSYQPYYAARADLRARIGQMGGAKADYQTAINLTPSAARRDYLRKKRLELGA